MRFTALSSAALMLAVAGGSPAFAQTAENTPWVELETTSVAFGIGGQSGDGVLRMGSLRGDGRPSHYRYSRC